MAKYVIKFENLHEDEQGVKPVEHLLRVFAINGNKPMSQKEMGYIYRQFRPYSKGRELPKGSDEDPTSSIRAHTSGWVGRCRKGNFGGHPDYPNQDGCLTTGPHRLCQKRKEGSKHRDRLFWVERSFARSVFRPRTEQDADEMADANKIDKSAIKKKRIIRMKELKENKEKNERNQMQIDRPDKLESSSLPLSHSKSRKFRKSYKSDGSDFSSSDGEDLSFEDSSSDDSNLSYLEGDGDSELDELLDRELLYAQYST